MIKVMLVDDEKIVRLGLQAMANWTDYGFSMCFEATNGLQALDILAKNPDIKIVFVDLQMPKMGGMAFVEQVAKQKSDVCIIILSAHDNYDLVRQGFRYGISDYIVKSEMNKAEVLRCLQEAAAKIKPKDAFILDDSDKAQLREKYLQDLFADIDTGAKKYIDMIKAEGNFTCLAVACVLIENRYEIKNQMPLLRSVSKDIAPEGIFIDIAPVTTEELGVFFAFENRSIASAGIEMGTVLQKFRSRVVNYVNLSVTIGVGHIIKWQENTICQQYKIAQQNADMRFVLGQGRTIYPKDVSGIFSHDIGSITNQVRELIHALHGGNEAVLMQELQKIFDTISQYNPKKIEKIFQYYMEVIFAIMQNLDESGVGTAELFDRNVNFHEEMSKFETRDELNVWVTGIVRWVFGHLGTNKKQDLNRTVITAMDYIKKNYHNKALTLKIVSEYVGISETHLSGIFAKQTGRTFTEYVTHLRIEKSKRLLKASNLKVYEIAEIVGYANAEYFSKIFKKVTGKRPNQFS